MNTETAATQPTETLPPVTFDDVATASAAKDVEARTTTVLRLVSTPLTTEQRAEREKRWSQLRKQICADKTELKELCTERREAIKALEDEMDRMAEESVTGVGKVNVELKRVPCEARNAWTFFRVDTGEEVVGLEEPMTAKDRQVELPLGEGEDSDAADPEDLLAMARECGDGDDESEDLDDEGTAIDDPESILASAKEDEAPKKRSRRARG